MTPRTLFSGLAATLLLLAPAARASQDGEAAAEGIRLGSAVLRPYAYGQFDMGNAFAGRPTSPDGGVQTRRFRLGGEIDFSDDWMFSLIGDFGGEGQDGPRLSTARLYEAMLEYSGLAPFKLRVGAFEPGLTMEDSQTSASTLFLEQAAIVSLAGAIVDGGRTGVELQAIGERAMGTLGLFGSRVGYGDDERERALTARVAGLVVQRENLTVHLGADALYRFRTPQEAGRRPGVTLSSAPEYTISPGSYLSTGFIEARGMSSGGLEAGIASGPLWLSGEWYRINVDRTDGKNPWFGGYYAQAAWTLLGKPRQWDAKDGAWGAPTAPRLDPARGEWGALEVGARFSHANLRSAEIDGGRQDVWSASLGWWPAESLRALLQYQNARISGGEDPHRFQAVMLRLQFRLD